MYIQCLEHRNGFAENGKAALELPERHHADPQEDTCYDSLDIYGQASQDTTALPIVPVNLSFSLCFQAATDQVRHQLCKLTMRRQICACPVDGYGCKSIKERLVVGIVVHRVDRFSHFMGGYDRVHRIDKLRELREQLKEETDRQILHPWV